MSEQQSDWMRSRARAVIAMYPELSAYVDALEALARDVADSDFIGDVSTSQLATRARVLLADPIAKDS